ncbi:MAG TPA: hypothetical protein DCX53_00830 [Anaerolineae bacterium]|nr:hypothetical protein [Anaerolineae bacterium]
MSLADIPKPGVRETTNQKHYPPSFIDRIKRYVQHLPLHYGLTYLLLLILLALAFHLIAWQEGWLPAPQFSPVLLLFPTWILIPLAFITYLDTIATEAFKRFSILLNISSEAREQLKYEFTVMPARNVIINSLVWSGIFNIYWFEAFDGIADIYQLGSMSINILYFFGLFSFFIGGNIYYHTFRQLILVHRTVSKVDRFDLFHLEPVYAFSILTSRTGICWIILSTLSVLFGPLDILTFQVFVTLSVQIALALAAFFLPLRVVYLRLTAEKFQQLTSLDLRIKETIARLHESVDHKNYADIEKFSVALTGLATESEILTKIPTLPWRPGLLTGFLSVVVLPLLLFLLQLALAKWLGG